MQFDSVLHRISIPLCSQPCVIYCPLNFVKFKCQQSKKKLENAQHSEFRLKSNRDEHITYDETTILVGMITSCDVN